MKKPYDFVIVGAGLFGAVFAREATDRGYKCLVVERRPHIAGNIYSQKIENIEVHQYGAHIFHTDDVTVWNYVQRFGTFYPFVNSPLAKYKDRLFSLPFNMHTFHQIWGVTTPEEARAKIAEVIAPYQTSTPSNLEEKALSMVGKELYEYLIKGYTEKQWGCSATELPAFIINRLPLRFTYDSNYFNDPYQGIPKDGYTAIVSKMLEGIEVRLHTNYLDQPSYYESIADQIIYTGRIDEFFHYQLGMLDYRSLRFETKVFATENYQGNPVINYTERDIPYTRVIEHRHFDRSVKSASTVVTWEYPDTFELGKEAYYPINNDRNNRLYQEYLQLSSHYPHYHFGGRLGQYRYLDMDDTILAAWQMVNQLTK